MVGGGDSNIVVVVGIVSDAVFVVVACDVVVCVTVLVGEYGVVAVDGTGDVAMVGG